MKIKADTPVENLDGKPYKADGKDLTLGMAVAEALASGGQGGKMKSYVLAKRFWRGGEVEIDEADAALVRSALEACTAYNAIILGQALVALEEAKAA